MPPLLFFCSSWVPFWHATLSVYNCSAFSLVFFWHNVTQQLWHFVVFFTLYHALYRVHILIDFCLLGHIVAMYQLGWWRLLVFFCWCHKIVACSAWDADARFVGGRDKQQLAPCPLSLYKLSWRCFFCNYFIHFCDEKMSFFYRILEKKWVTVRVFMCVFFVYVILSALFYLKKDSMLFFSYTHHIVFLEYSFLLCH